MFSLQPSLYEPMLVESAQPFRTSRPASCRRRAGDGDTVMPADSMAAILDPASPLPPEMIAPAWPMRRPGGAVRPAMKPTIGFLRPLRASSFRNCAASSSAEPPISPIMMIDFGLRIGEEHLQHVDELGALHRIAADADRRGLAEAFARGLEHRFIGQRAGARHDADRAGLEDVARHDADLAFARASSRPGSSVR